MDNISAILIVLYWIMVAAGGFLFKDVLELGREIRELRIKILDNKEDSQKVRDNHSRFSEAVFSRIVGLESYLRGQSIKATELQSEISKHPNEKIQHIIINPGYFKYDDLRQIRDKYDVYEVDDFKKDFSIVYIEED